MAWHWPRLALSLLLLCVRGEDVWKEHVPACVHSKTPVRCDWREAEPPVATTRARPLAELDAFAAACEEHLPAYARVGWESVLRQHAAPTKVVVFDVRHGGWVGLADSLPRIQSLLRLGRSWGRDTYLWSDGCADARGPQRIAVTARANGSECAFDPGEWFRTLGGVEWRWTGRRRRGVALKLGSQHGGVLQPETVLAYECRGRDERGRCTHAVLSEQHGRVAWERRGAWEGSGPTEAALDWLEARPEPWLRLELTNIDDFNNESRERIRFQEKCEMWLNTRPTLKLWRTLEHHLPVRVEAWRGMAVMFVRTGFADHVDLWAAARGEEAPPPLDADALHALFQPCPPDAPRVTVVARAGATPCVAYRTTAASEAFTPDAAAAVRCGGGARLPFDADARMTALEAYARCADAAARAAAAAAGGGPHGTLVLSDSPAVKCAVAALLGAEASLFIPAPTGHVQYSAAHGVAAATAADWYLAGLADAQLALAPSWFFTMAHVRSVMPQAHAEGLLRHGFPQFFEAGNERELTAKGIVPIAHDVMATLAGTCDA